MGTRADFYIGHGPDAEWLGSVGWDGYEWHEDLSCPLMNAATADDFRFAVVGICFKRKDFTRSSQGWPWPWDDSNLTDYAYVFDGGQVHVYCFGAPAGDDDAPKRTDWPNMKDQQNVAFDGRSGAIFIFK